MRFVQMMPLSGHYGLIAIQALDVLFNAGIVFCTMNGLIILHFQ